MTLSSEVDATQLSSTLPPIPELCKHEDCGGCWKGYPQSRFPNWTPSQVYRSRIEKAIKEYRRDDDCRIYSVNVDTKGYFTDAGERTVTTDTQEEYWDFLINQKGLDDIRVQAVFVENMSGPVLQMLGARYNIEPFFFSSSLSWIPSRFQEEVRPGKGDHITVTLTFLRTMDTYLPSASSSTSSTVTENANWNEEVINTQAPLYLDSGDGCYLVLDLLAVHLIRSTEGNTIISYHHTDPDATSALYLQERIRFAGQSVYWQSIFQKSPDPTFVLLTFIWHAMYAWDEALETLYKHICYLETQVISTSDMRMTQRLHIIRAHHLHYTSLLEDFRKAVLFILHTPNPAMDSLSELDRAFSRKLLEKECNHLLSEIDRLEMSRMMQDKRLKNVMNLVFSTVNIGDSRRMQDLTEAAVRDSAAMKQIAYLSMIFLPASCVAAVFGMNIKELGSGLQTLPHYFAIALPLTGLTIWIVMTFQSRYLFGNRHTTFFERLAWPVLLFKSIFKIGESDPSEQLPLR
ncbi:hypothetical protein VNI00_010139 [Paramarasmius palmivorus]|uniref:Uncharacterized protein n=1 Tax=Paramarasmius palmivorus TaxID=297713 RepID=A0AAW0CMH2_9AGAR